MKRRSEEAEAPRYVGKDNSQRIREVVGIFSDTEHLSTAVEKLFEAGFEWSALGVLAGEDTVRRELRDIYVPVEPSEAGDKSPRMAFVHKESEGSAAHSIKGHLYFVGTTTAAGLAVVSAGVLGGALLAAAAGVLAVGAVGAMAGKIIQQSDAQALEEQVEAGRILLFVRTQDSAEEARATRILDEHSNLGSKIVEVPA